MRGRPRARRPGLRAHPGHRPAAPGRARRHHGRGPHGARGRRGRRDPLPGLRPCPALPADQGQPRARPGGPDGAGARRHVLRRRGGRSLDPPVARPARHQRTDVPSRLRCPAAGPGRARA